MANPTIQRPLELVFMELAQHGLHLDPQGAFATVLRDLVTRSDKTQTNLGEILSVANFTGRTEAIGTTLQNVDSSGTILANGVDLSRAYLNKTVDNINDGTSFVRTTPNEKTGAGRGFNALNSNNQLASTVNGNPVNSNGAFVGSNPLSQSGVTTTILVAAWTMQFGGAIVGANSGSVDPGSFGTWYVYLDDPTFSLILGSVTYVATANIKDLTAADGRICLGKITTSGGGGGTGSGTGGGGKSGIMALV